MSESTTPVPPPVSPQSPDAPVPTLAPNTFGLVAIILAGLGFVMGVIPATSGFAWLLLLPAVVLAIIGLTRKGKKKGTSLAAIIVAVVGWIVAIIVASATLLVGLGEAISNNDAPPTAGSEADPAPDAPEGEVAGEAVIGDTVTSSDGVAFTVSAITCGIATAGPEALPETANGQFCEVRYTVLNGTNEPLYVFWSDITGYIGDAAYQVNGAISLLGDEYFSTEINPGLSVDAVVYIDIPEGAALDYVTYAPQVGFTGGVTVKAS